MQRVSAVDGSRLKASAELARLIEGNDHGSRRGVVACGLSHYHLWQQIAVAPWPQGRFHLVFEDDATFCEDFVRLLNPALEQLPADVDLVYLGGTDRLDVRPVGAEHHRGVGVDARAVRLSASFPVGLGSYAYGITSRGARQLCTWIAAHGMRRAIDGVMADAMWAREKPAAQNGLAYLLAPQLCGHADRRDSDIRGSRAALVPVA